MIAQHGPVACGSPIWLSGAAVFGTPLWSVSLGLGFGGVGGASPHVWVPQCVAGVSAVLTFSDTLPYCSPYCGALPSTSRVFGPLASSSLSLTPSHPIPPHPNPVALWCLLWDLPSTAQVPSPTTHTPAHTPLLPQGCHTPDVLCFLAGVCVQCTHRTWLTPVERALNKASPPRCTSTRDPLSPLLPSACLCLCSFTVMVTPGVWGVC